MLDAAAPPGPSADELAAAEDAAVLSSLGESNANDVDEQAHNNAKKKKKSSKKKPAALETRRDEIRSLLTREL